MFDCRVVVVVVVDRGMDVAATTLLLKTMLAMVVVPAHFLLPVVLTWVVLPFDIRQR